MGLKRQANRFTVKIYGLSFLIFFFVEEAFGQTSVACVIVPFGMSAVRRTMVLLLHIEMLSAL